MEVVKENVDGVMRLGCSVGGGIDQDEMMNPFSEGKFNAFWKNFKPWSSRSSYTMKKGDINVGDRIMILTPLSLCNITM